MLALNGIRYLIPFAIFMKSYILILFMLVFSAVCFSQKQPAESFSVESIYGKTFDSEELTGKIVVLYFWSTMCPICDSIAPKINAVAEKYRNDKTIFLAVTSDRKPKVEQFLKRHQTSFDIIAGNFDIIFKYGDKGKDGDFNLQYPTVFLINRQGNVELKSVGTKAVKELETSLQKLTAK
jgi:peroxiredoxin